MRLGNIAQIILFSVAITATVYTFYEGMNQYNEIRILATRNLALDQDKIRSICSKADFTNGVSSYLLNMSQSITNYTNQLSNTINNNNSTTAVGLINYIKNGNQQDLTDYIIKRVSPYIIFLVFAVISIICWIVYFFCCCCPCCCCSPKGCCCQGDCCPDFSVILAFLSFAGIIICCIIGFIYSAKFVKDVNSVTCQFLTFYNNTVNGEYRNSTPRWIGVSGIQNVLSQTSSAIDQVSQNSQTAFQNTQWTTTDPPAFESQLNTTYYKFASSSITNYNPANSKKSVAKITPTYITKYGTYTKDSTILNSIYKEFDIRIKSSITLIDQAKEYSKTISQYSQPIKDSISSINTSLQPLTSTFTKIEDSIIKNWIDYQNIINDSAINGFLIVYAVLTGISVLGILFMLFFVCCCKIQCLRFFLHLFWIIMMIIMVLTFIIGTVFGFIGLISSDGVSVLNWTFSGDNLNSASPKIIEDKKSAGYINICYNGNGDLASEAFGTSSSNTQYLEKLYNVSNVLTSTKTKILQNKNSVVITEIGTQLDNFKVNFVLTTDTSLNSDSMINQFLEWNAYTDSSNSGTYQKGCSSNTKDYWTTDATSCPANYNKIQGGGANAGSQSCLIFSEWSSSQVSSRYSSNPSGCGSTGSSDFSTVSSAATGYFNAMSSYSTDNSNLINSIKTEHNNLNGSFVSMSEKLLDLLAKVDGIISPLVNVFQRFVGDSGLFTLINCNYMGRDLRGLFSIMSNELSPSSTSLMAVVIAVSFLQFIAVFSTLIVVLRKKQTGDHVENHEKNSSGHELEMHQK